MKNQLKRVISLIAAAAFVLAFVPQDRVVEQTSGALAATAATFSDISGIPEEAAINRWAALGVVNGSDGLFSPEREITRIEFYSFINRALGCIAKKGIQKFTDIPDDAWYYSEVQRAYAAGLTNGMGPNTFGANEKLKREMAVTIFGRVFGLYTENTSVLSKYSDNTEVTYGRGYLAAFTQMNIDMSRDGKFEPNSYMTRAEAVWFIDMFFSDIYAGSDSLSNRTITGNALIRNQGLTVEKMTLKGSLIIGDGVGTGNVTLRNCVIEGRLVVRGGGSESVNLSGTTVKDGIYVYNANGVTRLYNTNNSSKVGEVTAITDLILEGVGSGTLYIPENANPGATFTLRDVALDSVNIAQPNADVYLKSGTVDNMRFVSTATQARLDIASGAKANYVEINAANTAITGNGSIDTLYIAASGARVSIFPRYRYILQGLSAVISGVTYSGTTTSGSTIAGTSSNVSRNGDAMRVDRDIAETGGTGLTLVTTTVGNNTEVSVTQAASTSVQLTERRRLGYWIGFFIPVPDKYQDPIVKITYTFEGATDAIYSVPVEVKGVTSGINVYVPVKAGSSGAGTLDTSVNIVWGDATYETIRFYSGSKLALAAPTAAQINTMVGYYSNTQLRAYNGITTYSGTEALKRLLLGDNPLGLDTVGFEAYDEAVKNSFVAQMYNDRATLTSKAAIQQYLGVSSSNDIGALYAVNNAMSATALCGILENQSYAGQLGIDTSTNSAYMQLSSVGKLAVATAMLTARGATKNAVFDNEAAAKTAFETAVAVQRKSEVTVLSSINNANTPTLMKAALEKKENYSAIGLVVDSDPYKSFSVEDKTSISTGMVAARQFTSLDTVRSTFDSLVSAIANTPPPVITPETSTTILSVTTDPAELTLIVGQTATITPTITTANGNFSDPAALTWVADSTKAASLDAATGVVTAKAAGKAKITVTSKTDTKKKNTVNVEVINPVDITSLTMPSAQLTVNAGMQVQVKYTKVPADGNEPLYWSIEDPEIATVNDGILTGISPGYTTVMVRTASNIRASCKVFVASDTTAVSIDKTMVEKGELNTDETISIAEYISIGLECTTKLSAMVSPITISNPVIDWESSDTTIATVDFQGNVKAGSQYYGYTRITARLRGYPDVYDEVWIRVKEGKSGVTISNKSLSMYKNGTFQLSAEVHPAAESDPTALIWTVSGATGVISVNSTGLVTALGPGTATVSASYGNDSTANDSCIVTVLPGNLTVTVNPNKAQNIVAGDSFIIGVTFSPTPENQTVKYRSRNTAIATVGDDGLVTGVGKGTTVIEVIPEANNSVTQIQVTVTDVPLQKIAIQSSPMTVARGSETKLVVTFIPSNATYRDLTWSSNSPGTVSVTQEGYITAHMPTATMTAIKGSSPTSYELVDTPVVITATSTMNGSISAACLVSVDERGEAGVVESVDILLNTWVFKVGETQKISVLFNKDSDVQPLNTAVRWSSSNEGVAKVDSSGYMQALSPGVTTIAAISVDGGFTSSKTIIVGATAVEQVNFTGLSPDISHGRWIEMTVGSNTSSVKGSIYPAEATAKELSWVSSDSTTVKVEPGGKLTALKTGVATITAIAQSGIGDPAYRNYAYTIKAPGELNADELELSGIVKTNTDSGITYIHKDGSETIVLDPNKAIPVIVRNIVSNTFKVWSTPAIPTNLSFMPVVGTQYVNDKLTLSALLTPSTALQYQKGYKIEWTITDPLGKFTATTSSMSYVFTPRVAGTVSVTCVVTVDAYPGPDSSDWPGVLQSSLDYNPLDKPAVSVTTNSPLTFNVQSRPITGLSIPAPKNPDGSQMDVTDLYENQLPLQLTTASIPSNASNQSVTWSSNNQTAATVNANGLVTFKGPGTVTITAASVENSSIKDTVTFTVKPLINPTGIAISSYPKTLSAGTSSSIIAVLTSAVDNAYTYQGVKWTSSDPSILEIASNGDTTASVTAKKAGTVTVTAECLRDPTIKAACVIEVTAASVPQSPEPLVMTVAVGQQSSALQSLLGIQTYNELLDAEFKSDGDGAVAVSDAGVITAVRDGAAVVTGTLNGEAASIMVVVGSGEVKPVVTVPPSSIRLRTSAKVVVGGGLTLYPDVTPVDADGMYWNTSDSAVATVSNGVVTGIKAGTAKITLTSADGKIKATCTVTVVAKVNKAVTAFRISRTTLNLVGGQSLSLSVSVSPSGATLNGVGWYSSNPSVAEVDVNGRVTGVSSGKATIYAVSDEGGWTAKCEVTVTIKVTSVRLDKTTLSLSAGETYKLIPAILPGDATAQTVTWRTSNSNIATVDANGTVKAVKKGTVTITATCDGKSVTCRVTVK